MDIFAPIQFLADTVTYTWLNFSPDGYFGPALDFFIYDVIKISLLLLVINYIMAISRYYFPMEKVRDILLSRRWYGLDYLLAAILGVVTPFCSCSSIPLFIGFLSAGIPLGVTFTFLISSPLVNESSLALFPAMFGLKTTLIYNVIGVIISILGGLLINQIGMEKFVEQSFLKFKSRNDVIAQNQGQSPPFKELLSYWWGDGWMITRQVFPYVLLGVGIGALIHGFVPTNLIETYLATRAWWVVPLATVAGVPLYANSVSVIPVIEALVGKGIPLGSALAFMTATVTLSIPEAMMLKKVMKWQLLAAFFGITTIGIMVIGYAFNLVFH